MGCRINNGYGHIQINKRRILAHRYFAELAIGRRLNEGELVCHHCDNPPCVNPAHLFVGTVKDNSEDMVTKGRAARGRLSAEEARAIYCDDRIYREIASDYGVSSGVVGLIKSRRLYLRDLAQIEGTLPRRKTGPRPKKSRIA